MNSYNLPSKVLEILLSNDKTYSIYSPKTPFGPNHILVAANMSAACFITYIFPFFFLLLNFFGALVDSEGKRRGLWTCDNLQTYKSIHSYCTEDQSIEYGSFWVTNKTTGILSFLSRCVQKYHKSMLFWCLNLKWSHCVSRCH